MNIEKKNMIEYVGEVDGGDLLVPVHEGEVREEPDGEARPSVAGRESPLHADLHPHIS